VPGRIFERLPYLGDQAGQIRLGNERSGPKMFVQLDFGERAGSVIDEDFQQLEGFGGEVYFGLAPKQLARISVKRYAAKVQSHAPPTKNPENGQELVKTLTSRCPIVAAEEIDVIRYVAAALATVVLSAACESRTPTAPSANPQPSAVPPVPPTGSGPAPIPGTPIVAGSGANGIVEAGDPVCFPNWDSSGHCRQFDLAASSDGTLRATLKWEDRSRGVYDPELFVVSPDGAWLYSEDPWPERHLSFRGSAGQTYRIVVIGYQPPQAFEVLVEVQ
jgi:hypothetical protein